MRFPLSAIFFMIMHRIILTILLWMLKKENIKNIINEILNQEQAENENIYEIMQMSFAEAEAFFKQDKKAY